MSLFEEENQELVEQIKKSIVKQRIPVNANIFLTNMCNFKCLHCYVQSEKNMDMGSLSTSEWKRIIDILKSKGCISVVFSGGEVLSTKKFLEIYEYTSKKNLFTSFISNLSLLNDEHISLFSQIKPRRAIVTIYGTSNRTYQEFCGVHGMWDRVRENVLRLKSIGVNIQLQTVLNKVNFHELREMKAFARENQLPFIVFRNINCEIDGNARPLNYQISPEEEIESYAIMEDGDTFLNLEHINSKMWQSGYKKCFAGISNCYIDCCGNMFLCNQCTDSKFNIMELGFDNAWEKIYMQRTIEIERKIPCSTCAKRNLCGKCAPVFHKLECSVGFPFSDCKNINMIENKIRTKDMETENDEFK